jgi:RHS repeat-associated protein
MKNKLKWLSRTLAVVLTVLLAVEAVPFQAFAQEADPAAKVISLKGSSPVNDPEGVQTYTLPDEPLLAEEKEPSLIIGEEASLRTDNTKVFRCEDGTFLAAVYATPVHYQDKPGHWKDINNTLMDGGTSLQTAATDTPVSVPKDITRDSLELSDAEHTIGFRVVAEESNSLTAQSTLVEIQEDVPQLASQTMQAKSIEEQNAEIMEAQQVKSDVVYRDLFSGADLEYEILPGRVKESIIVKTAQPEYTYAFEFDLGKLTAVPKADGSIWLMENTSVSSPVFVLEAPYMTDADHQVSRAVTMEIADGILTVSADAAWINEPSRAFPVTIDPTIKIETSNNSIEYASVANNNTGDLDPNLLLVGNYTSRGIARGFMKIPLPVLPDCSVLTNAWVQLEDGGQAGNALAYVKVRSCTRAWSKSSVSWAEQPGFEGITLDYQNFDASKNKNAGGIYRWNITAAAKDWYENGVANNGIALIAGDETLNRRMYFFGPNVSGVPALVVEYVNNNGLESNWTYETFDLGRSGTANVNDYSGSLVYTHPDISMNGNRLPIGFDHVYSTDTTNYSGSYNGMKFGTGFRLSLLEQIIPITSSSDPLLWNNNYRFRYIDGDGTTHFFLLKSGKIQHEYDPTLTINSSGTLMSDEAGNKKTFNSSGWLVKVEDANSTSTYPNAQTITYNGSGQISQISDPVGRTVRFTYDGSGYLITITDPANRVTLFKYDGGKLTRIIYPDAAADEKDRPHTEFAYDGSKINRIYSPGKQYLGVSYRNNRVSSVQEGGYYDSITTTGGGSGKSINDYSAICQLWYRFVKWFLGLFGVDYRMPWEVGGGGSIIGQIINTIIHNEQTGPKTEFAYSTGETVVSNRSVSARETIVHLMFDHGGRVSATRDQYGRAGYTKYDGNGSVTQESSVQEYVNNLVRNSSGESSGIWLNTGDTTGSSAFVSSQHYVGNRAIELQCTGTGKAVTVFQEIAAKKGTTYTVSAYLKIPPGFVTFSGGVFIGFMYETSSGSIGYEQSAYEALPRDWSKISYTFTLPLNAKTAKIYPMFGMEGATGTIYIDAVQMEESTVSNRYNLLENSSFDFVDSAASAAFKFPGWEIENYQWKYAPDATPSSGDSITADGTKRSTISSNDIPKPISGTDYGVQLGGDYNLKKRVRQEVMVGGKAGQTVVFGAWVQAANATGQANNSPTNRRRFAVSLTIKGKQNDSSTWEYDSVAFDADVTGQQYVSDAFTLTQNVESIVFYVLYYDEANYVTFNNACMYLDSFGTDYSYDNSGRLVRIKTDADKIDYSYNSQGDVNKIVTSDGTELLEYSNDHNLTKVVTSDNVTMTYTYAAGSYGNPSSVTTTSNGKSSTISYTYASNYNFNRAMTNALGTTTYDYNAVSGVLNSETDPNGKITTYQYDPYDDRLTNTSASSSAGAENASYNYVNGTDLLSGLTSASGTQYKFEYDDQLRPSASYVGNQLLTSSSYDTNGMLIGSNFGNGQSYSPTYDKFSRVVSEQYNRVKLYEYSYDKQNQIVALKDNESEKNWTYDYALGGQLIEARDNSNNVLRYGYSTDGKLTALYHANTGTTISNTGYTYTSDGKPSQVQLKSIGDGTGTVGYTYNGGMGRISQTSHRISSSATVTTDYAYYASGSNSSDLISQMQYKKGSTNLANFEYTYDKAGNILTIKQDSTLRATYTYDGLNQLTKEVTNWPGQGSQTVEYTYGLGGNLQSKNITGANAGTVSYAYGNSDWKDQLTAFNGKTIQYDAIGNATKYDGYSYTWQKGRQLASISGNGVNLTFKYNQDGWRTKKNSTEFIYSGDLLLAQMTNSGAVRFFYDHSGRAIGYSGAYGTFYYLRNAQSDVVGLYDNSGNIVANYVYDSWGKLLSTTGSAAGTAGAENPIRYRGYYYDTETGLYYCQSRYYNPEWGRWINADDQIDPDSMLGSNLYAYCENDPINKADPSGHFAIVIAGVAITAEMIMIGIALILALCYVFIPSFRKQVNIFVWGILTGIMAAVGVLVDTLTTTVKKAKAKAKAKGKTPKTALHHIVAKGDRRAVGSRELLSDVGIGINNPMNLVRLNMFFHQFLHTSAYHLGVYGVLKTGNRIGGKLKNAGFGVVGALLILHGTLWAINKVFFR